MGLSHGVSLEIIDSCERAKEKKDEPLERRVSISLDNAPSVLRALGAVANDKHGARLGPCPGCPSSAPCPERKLAGRVCDPHLLISSA